NTIADDRPAGGNILALPNGGKKLVALNNLLVTRNKLNTNLPGQVANNPNASWDQVASAARYDYRLKANSPLLGKYVMPSAANGVNLIPQREYHHPASSTSLKSRVQAPGALQSLAAP
ncbi:MAG TPA: hypothetical protein VL381_02065, partial [Rhodocyclaceae bacterium]|nr:hypothetical protein [Rhodocyclaceae bacterium]